MAAYYGVIHKDATSDYGLSFPDLPGCITAGSTLEELVSMGREVLGLHLEGMEEDGDPIPEPGTFREILDKVENEEGFQGIALITIQKKYKRTRVNISLAEPDLDLIDAAAAKAGIDRSAYLVMATKRVAMEQ